MYSKATLAGHPIQQFLVGFPIVCCTGTVVGFAVTPTRRRGETTAHNTQLVSVHLDRAA